MKLLRQVLIKASEYERIITTSLTKIGLIGSAHRRRGRSDSWRRVVRWRCRRWRVVGATHLRLEHIGYDGACRRQ
jgi:hypothetical protein